VTLHINYIEYVEIIICSNIFYYKCFYYMCLIITHTHTHPHIAHWHLGSCFDVLRSSGTVMAYLGSFAYTKLDPHIAHWHLGSCFDVLRHSRAIMAQRVTRVTRLLILCRNNPETYYCDVSCAIDYHKEEENTRS
jgi:hypothetical protein